MANHKSAIKRHRQSLLARARNRAVKTRVRNVIKAVRVALTAGDSATAETALLAATKILDKAATKKVIHWKTAARNISRLSTAVNKSKQA
ncbi:MULTISPECIES: 30S ribosomal protein S20 [Solidesulfovibrio]|uniref:30S ribosomal protein S20 n=1 Tax=Solidesulfovibrio TaxID=2910984 RepID=UPI00049670A4|nr:MULTISPECIES: 30S ribosomal protein S20 [Solidesulfovibrio]MEA5088450.1 30S ribosomal protein S20 [Solidesulfovibrio sp.]HCR12046.1 30S ribosomal protein S20 [Desulfovibrio sp.]HML61274.1 30S ribosomal protein S20 [Solidesulfovibrio sp.]